MEMNDEYAIGRSFASSRDLGAGGGGFLGNLAAQSLSYNFAPCRIAATHQSWYHLLLNFRCSSPWSNSMLRCEGCWSVPFSADSASFSMSFSS